MARILYIEDYMPAALTMNYVLAELSHECVIAATGQEAIEKYKTEPFDLVLVDNQLPDMQGPDVARAIRDFERDRNRAAVTLVGYSAAPKSAESYREAGMNGFAMKSLSLNDVRRLLDDYLPRPGV